MAELARADPAGARANSAAQCLQDDIREVERLLSLSQRPVIAQRLASLLTELQEEKAKISLLFQKAHVGFPRVTAPSAVPASAALLGGTSSDSIQTTHHLGSSCSLAEGLTLPHHAMPGIAPLMNLDRMVPGFMPTLIDERQFSGASDHSDSGTFSHVGGLHERPGLPSPLGPPLWPLAFGPGNPTAMPAQPFQQLTTCSWEQNDTIVKVYVPLKGIQTDMLRPAFTSNSAEVRVVNLQGKNYIFTLAPTFCPIAEAGCTAAASKTRKNIIITLQKLHTFLPEHRQWRGLYGEHSGLPGMAPM